MTTRERAPARSAYMPPRNVFLEDISQEDCQRLLRSHQIGRLAVVLEDQPEIFPVNYELLDGEVVIRTSAGKKLHGASQRRVAFEIDGIDEYGHRGWDVVVHGTAYDISTAYDEQARELPLEPWVGGEGKNSWIRIVPTAVTGRRIVPSPSEAPVRPE